MTKRKVGYWWLLPILLLVAGIVCQLGAKASQHSYQQVEKQVTKQQKVLTKQASSVNQTLAAKQPNVTKATDKLDDLFTKDWTISTQKEFDAKAKAMTPLVTEDVVKNSLDFKPDTDRMMTQTGVIMVFDHMAFLPLTATDNLVTGQAVVFVKSHFEGKPEALTRFVYHIAYNPQTDKITQLDRVGTFQLQSDSTTL